MRVPDTIRKCVIFICHKNENEEYIPGGTGFFLAVKLKQSIFSYLITAKHVIQDCSKLSPDNKIYLRANSIYGGTYIISSHEKDWYTHPINEAIDVAVANLQPTKDKFDHRVLSTNMGLKIEHLEDEEVGLGDEVFITGLFLRYSGKEKNIPIIRVGNIAAFPDEEIETRYGKIPLYLLESRSIGGLSGSPVFVHKPGLLFDKAEGTLSINTDWHRLIGIIHGHWNQKIFRIPQSSALSYSVQSEAVNMGIAMITPYDYILEVINHPDLVKQREESADDDS